MKILVTGSNGQLGYELRKHAADFLAFTLEFVDIEQVDITDKQEITKIITSCQPDVVMNCAAYTSVDKAEIEQEAAFAVNALAVDSLSELSNEFNFFLLHISTDYVFDGKSFLPFVEDNEMKPDTYYGISKSAGEIQMCRHCRHGAIIRTSWLYSSHGHNFVKTILKKSRETKTIQVIEDQIGTPTYAADLALFILNHLDTLRSVGGVATYHFSNSGVASWYDFACAIVEIAKIECLIVPILTDSYPTATLRPHYSVLNKEKIKKIFDYIPRHWKSALEDCIKLLENN
jgi:dTDP-4-dehydrorhamnose reductase